MLKVPITAALTSSDWFTKSTRGNVGGACELPQSQLQSKEAVDVFSVLFALSMLFTLSVMFAFAFAFR
jgi:hypothetical protein